MSQIDPEILSAVLRRNFPAFIEKVFQTVAPGETYHHNWHIDAMAYQLEGVVDGEITRLIINVPPRHLKSIVVSVAFPAWLLGHDPTTKFICASYGQELATQHSLDALKVMQSPWYQKVFPGTKLSSQKQTQDQFHTTENGFRRATSVGGALTGLGGDIIIIDDPMKAEDAASEIQRQKVNDWFDKTLLSRLNDKKNGAFIIVSQRLHEDDLVGHVVENSEWDHLSIPAEAPSDVEYTVGPDPKDVFVLQAGSVIDPEREPEIILREIQRTMGSRAYSAQYLQDPVPAGGNLFHWKWMRFYDFEDVRLRDFDYIFQSWDTASSVSDKADYSVCSTWGVIDREHFFLLDIARVQKEFPELLHFEARLHGKFQPDAVIVESIGSGLGFYQQLRRIYRRRALDHTPTIDKIARAEAMTVLFERGQVFVPKTAPWLEQFRNEMIAFPNGRHDDQVDSVVQFLRYSERLVYLASTFGKVARDDTADPKGGEAESYRGRETRSSYTGDAESFERDAIAMFSHY